MIISGVQQCKRNKNRVNIYIDGEFSFACYTETAVKNGIKEGAGLTRESMDSIKDEDNGKYAVETALSYVSYAPRTRREVVNKLKEKRIDSRYIEAAVAKLAEYGYIDDGAYAGLYAKEQGEKRSSREILNKMLVKGIDLDTAKEAVARNDDVKLIVDMLKRLENKYVNDGEAARKRKMTAYLYRKGFDYDDIKKAMNGGYED